MSSSIESLPDNEFENVPKNYYFIESQVAPLILNWQKYYVQQKDIEYMLQNPEVELSESDKTKLENQKLELIKEASPYLDKIMIESCKVIKGVIFRAGYHKRENYNICYTIAVEACLKALPRFDPAQGTAFNYISLTAKKSILYYLIKKRKKKDKEFSVDFEYLDDENLVLKNILKQEERTIKNLEIENFIDTIYNMLQEQNEHKSLSTVVEELKDYLFYNQGKYDKKDFFKWAKADGISSNLLRKFVKFLKENREQLYQEVGVY